MVEGVGRGFRDRGFAASGVDALAKEAGVTSGAFYAHFKSKAVAFEAALEAGLDEVIRTIPQFQRESGKEWTQAFTDYYLGKKHRDNLAGGCTMAALSSDVVRAAPKARILYEAKMQNIAEVMATGLAGGTHDERVARSWSMLSVLIGGITMSRAMRSAKAWTVVAESTAVAAVRAAGRTKRVTEDASGED